MTKHSNFTDNETTIKTRIFSNYTPFLKNTLIAKQNEIVQWAYTIRKMNTIEGSVLPITGPLLVGTHRKRVMVATVMSRNRKYLRYHAPQWSQLFRPIIFMDSLGNQEGTEHIRCVLR